MNGISLISDIIIILINYQNNINTSYDNIIPMCYINICIIYMQNVQ